MGPQVPGYATADGGGLSTLPLPAWRANPPLLARPHWRT